MQQTVKQWRRIPKVRLKMDPGAPRISREDAQKQARVVSRNPRWGRCTWDSVNGKQMEDAEGRKDSKTHPDDCAKTQQRPNRDSTQTQRLKTQRLKTRRPKDSKKHQKNAKTKNPER